MSHKPTDINRREFTKASAAATLATTFASVKDSKVKNSNETIRMGFVGVGNRGSQLMKAFAEHKDCEFVGVADVYQPYLDRARDTYGNDLIAVEDYRKLLDRKDIDAIAIATPDHWHAIQAINVMSADKDVYVEKPLCATIHEGRQMVEAAKRFGRISQVGLHRRSMSIYHQLREFIQTDKVGKITVSRAYRLNNMYPDGIGKLDTQAPPANLNWDQWLGPRPKQAYQDNIAPYKFRWWQRFSSQMGNWGVHYFDVIRWMLGEEAPVSVSAMGGRFAVKDDRTIPDTAEAVFELPGGSLLVFGQYEASSNPALAYGEIELRGTQGTIYSSSSGYKVLSEKPGQFQAKEIRGEASNVVLKEPNHLATANHARNFLDSIKTRKKTHCPMIEGHRSTIFAHLANISLATKARLNWDATKEQFDNEEANHLLHYEYRKGFELPKF
ncbi:MAG: Gfo/Idh/MocA family oxidoreductase [Mariniblastus sp.]|nr:Gfo/Idh/MocA family oxidoreductase [Mariniblastus sp.]